MAVSDKTSANINRKRIRHPPPHLRLFQKDDMSCGDEIVNGLYGPNPFSSMSLKNAKKSQKCVSYRFDESFALQRQAGFHVVFGRF